MKSITCLFFKHKWREAFDPTQLQCDNCLNIKPKPHTIPDGTFPCPWDKCKGWITPPYANGYTRDEKGVSWYKTTVHSKCNHCEKQVRWERLSTSAPWPAPVPIFGNEDDNADMHDLRHFNNKAKAELVEKDKKIKELEAKLATLIVKELK